MHRAQRLIQVMGDNVAKLLEFGEQLFALGFGLFAFGDIPMHAAQTSGARGRVAPPAAALRDPGHPAVAWADDTVFGVEILARSGGVLEEGLMPGAVVRMDQSKAFIAGGK